MPVEVVPNLISWSDFSGGDNLDSPPASIPPNELEDSMNVVPDRATGGLRLRPGFARQFGPILSDANMQARQLFYWEVIFAQDRHKYLIAICSNGVEDTAANVKFMVYSFDTATWANKKSLRVRHPGYEHWGAAVGGVWYGGTGGIPMYSYDPETGTFNDDASAPSVKTWVDAVNDAVTPSTESARDYAFKLNMKVKYNSKFYAAARDIRFGTWDNDTHYKRGDRISRWATWGSTSAYWKSFECVQSHESSDAAKAPGTGAVNKDYWRKVRLGPIIDPNDENGAVGKDWFFMPVAPKGIIGTFHADRLFVRDHDDDNWSRIRYSAPLKIEKHADIADLTFDPTNWAPVDDLEGNGGGWMNVESHSGDGIRGFQSFGSYLIIFKRWSTWVLAGRDDTTWVLRNLDPEIGSIGPRSFCVQDGLVYFLGLDGFVYVTDGTQVTPAPGSEKVATYIHGRITGMMATEADNVLNASKQNWLPTMTAFRDYIYISLPKVDGTDPITLIYHPESHSFWKSDMPVLDMATGHISGNEIAWFVGDRPPALGTGSYPRVYQFDETGTTDEAVLVDDVSAATRDIPWSITHAWMNFGTQRNDRRIRRSWVLAEADTDVTLLIRRNYASATAMSTVRTPVSDVPHFEGLKVPDCRALQYKVSGTKRVNYYSVSVDTEPRRDRYHVNDPNT